MKRSIPVVIVAIAVATAACGGGEHAPEVARRGGHSACELFGQVQTDFEAGRITTADYPAKMREVATAALGQNELIYDTARLAQSQMAEQGKSPDDPEVQKAIGEISDECDVVLTTSVD